MATSATSATQRALIFTGGQLGDWSISLIQDSDYLIGADRGAFYLVQHGFRPHLALGDFDSIDARQFKQVQDASEECQAYDPIDKDWTDTELAIREAIKRGFKKIKIVGGLGTRFDHSLANVQLLAIADAEGCDASLCDENNEISLLSGPGSRDIEISDRYPVVSLLPMTPVASGITLDGFQYPLNEATLRTGMSLGVSNLLAEPSGTIHLREGRLLVIRCRD
ncbi:thiamine diphosphokinase [Cohnella sp. AR92]|uniref:thiamine diphosphokinase n=1 Tax=Cohnella sp. AR92 TaxID=648716 RepID=UPI000F8D48DA|nr:thiamine diphosphokinase [Cohnella sp. AR92]RUS46840.1 thiamine diphosphokinase [Cohnella sp. AR92]